MRDEYRGRLSPPPADGSGPGQPSSGTGVVADTHFDPSRPKRMVRIPAVNTIVVADAPSTQPSFTP